MKRIPDFLLEIMRQWGSLATGGALVGAIGIWQGTGHPVAPWVYYMIGGSALLVAFFKIWIEQVVRAETAEALVKEARGRPDIALSCSPADGVSLLNFYTQEEEIGTKGSFIFCVKNGGVSQAVNISVEDIVLPISEETRLRLVETDRVLSAQIGVASVRGVAETAEWIVRFKPVTSVSPGQELEIPYTIDNVGSMQRRDLGYCLLNTVRPNGFGPLKQSVTLKFSNRDGNTWLQTYEIIHRFEGGLDLIFDKLDAI